MLEMVREKIEGMVNFLKDEKIEYKRACSLLNGYLMALREFNLITSEESHKIISDFCLDYFDVSKEEE